MSEIDKIICGDCKTELLKFEDNYFDAICTDPPYELTQSKNSKKGFMGKAWDASGIAYDVEVWKECLRVLKPGGHMLAFGGTRTYHRMACAIEDAGFEIRDMLEWVYSQGFPKSLSIDKTLDKMEYNKWLNVSKAIDKIDIEVDAILDTWKQCSSNVNYVEKTFLSIQERGNKTTTKGSSAREIALKEDLLDERLQTIQNVLSSVKFAERISKKSITETGMNTLKSDSAQENVLLSIDHTKSPSNAIIAELKLYEAPHTQNESSTCFAQEIAEKRSLQPTTSSTHVKFAEKRQPGTNQPGQEHISIALCNVKEWLNERTVDRTKAVEALKIWLSRTKSSSRADTIVLCAALTESLKLTILSQSKTFQNLDMTSQMECVYATTAIITESIAVCLITSTANMLKTEALDKMAGAERERISDNPNSRDSHGKNPISMQSSPNSKDAGITIASSPLAKQWAGFGSALKPAHEPICLARKPLDGCTIAENVIRWGVGGLNIDGCRVATSESTERPNGIGMFHADIKQSIGGGGLGRFPANLILSYPESIPGRPNPGKDAVMRLFPETKSGAKKPIEIKHDQTGVIGGGKGFNASKMRVHGPNTVLEASSGSAARFFQQCPITEEDYDPLIYCAKASRTEREKGLDGMPDQKKMYQCNGQASTRTPNQKERDAGIHSVEMLPAKNNHPTVKPLSLMRYLCRLITPPGGLILDPFGGSGTTALAAIQEGFHYILIEKEEEYCDIARKRISVLPTRLDKWMV